MAFHAIFPDVTVLLGDPRLPDATKPGRRYGEEDFKAVRRLRETLATLPAYRFTYLDDHARMFEELIERPPSFVLNFCDTGYANVAAHELHVPALLELLGIPYSGAGPTCLAQCFDKALVHAVAEAHGIPVPAEIFVRADERPSLSGAVFPALIKPNRGDGSVGITRESVVPDPAEARSRLDRLRAELPGSDFLIQEFLDGPEYGVGLVGNPAPGLEALPVLEVDYDGLDAALPRILAWESKTVPDSPYWTKIRCREARLSGATLERLVDRSRLLFERLGCRDYARFDFRAGADGEIRLLEVNPNPAWCWDGKLNQMAGFAGHDESWLLRAILEAAQERAAAAVRCHDGGR